MHCTAFLIPVLAGWIAVGPTTGLAADEAPPQTKEAAAQLAAGRTLEDWDKDVRSPNRFVRLRAVKMLAAFGPGAVPELTAALSHQDDAVRYWAASALGDLGKKAAPAVPSLLKIADRERLALSISAAYALCRAGDIDAGLPPLVAALKDPEKATACCAADFLARIGPPAKDALPALRVASQHSDTHIARASKEALNRIEPKESSSATN